MSCVLVFVDGLGLGADCSDVNPLVTDMPLVTELVGPIVQGREMPVESGPWVMTAVDVSMGIDGLPQSATGQSALLTGVNAAKVCGRHVSGYPTRDLRELLYRHSLFGQVASKGGRGTFANAFRPESVVKIADGTYRATATTAAASGAGIRIRTFADVKRGRAVTHDITGWSLYQAGYEVEEITPEQAAGYVSRLSDDYQFVLVEHFLTDAAGHARDRDMLRKLLMILDRFVVAIADTVDPGTTMIVTSDHGNCEDLTTSQHTYNPVPVIIYGKQAEMIGSRCKMITDVAPAIMAVYDREQEQM